MSDTLVYNKRSPHMLIVDGFYKDPDKIREFALSLPYSEEL